MDELEISKIFGAGCAALLAFVGFGQLGSAVVSVDQLKEAAYVVEVAEAETDEDEVVERMPIGQLMAMADVADGPKVFKKCSACHKVEEGSANGVGPMLYGVVGREIGGVDGYSYSSVLAGMDGVWDFAALDGFLEAPKTWAKGTKMGFAGLSKEADRASVIAWLNEQSASPLPMPAVEEDTETEAAEVEEQDAEVEVAEVSAPENDTEVEPAAEDVKAAEVEAEKTEEVAVSEETAESEQKEEVAASEPEKEAVAESATEEKATEEVAEAEKPKAAEAEVTEEKVAEAKTEEVDEAKTEEVEESKEVEVAAAKVEEEKKPAKAAASTAAAAAAGSGLMALADMDKGAKVFRKCKACHKVEAGKNGVGPNLYGVVGRDIGSVDGFKYSEALSGKGGKWDVEALDGFLLNPKKWAPGTKMAFRGLRKDVDRASVIAWLNEQSDNPLPLE